MNNIIIQYHINDEKKDKKYMIWLYIYTQAY